MKLLVEKEVFEEARKSADKLFVNLSSGNSKLEYDGEKSMKEQKGAYLSGFMQCYFYLKNTGSIK